MPWKSGKIMENMWNTTKQKYIKISSLLWNIEWVLMRCIIVNIWIGLIVQWTQMHSKCIYVTHLLILIYTVGSKSVHQTYSSSSYQSINEKHAELRIFLCKTWPNCPKKWSNYLRRKATNSHNYNQTNRKINWRSDRHIYVQKKRTNMIFNFTKQVL